MVKKFSTDLFMFNPVIFSHLVDNSSIVSKKHVQDALKLNIQDQNRKFILEIENDKYLPFWA